MPSARLRYSAGASLIELTIAIAVVAIALTGSLLLVDTTSRDGARPMLARQAIALADATLEEVLAKPYADPDDANVCGAPEPGRASFDDVCDYDGYDVLGGRDALDVPIAGLEDYRVQIAIDRTARLGTLVGAAEVLRVDATVTDPLGGRYRLSGYRTRR